MSNYEKYPSKLKSLLEDFKLIQDQTERVEMLIYYSEQFKDVPTMIAQRPFPDKNRVPACESQAYVWSTRNDDNTIKYYFAVENPQGISAKAMAAILDETVSNHTAEEIVNIDIDIVYEFFGKNLSMGKSAGLTSLVEVVRSHAKTYLSN